MPQVAEQLLQNHLLQLTQQESKLTRENAGLVDDDASPGLNKAPEAGGSADTIKERTKVADADADADISLACSANTESSAPKLKVSSAESVVTAEVVPVAAGSSAGSVVNHDDEEMRVRALRKAAALEQDSDDDEVVPGTRLNAQVNHVVFLQNILPNYRLIFKLTPHENVLFKTTH